VYRHTQIGWVIIWTLGGFTVFFLVVASNLPRFVTVPVGLICFFLLALFWSLTVEVRDGFIWCTFGIGLIRRKIPLSEILEVVEVRNRWWYGWGIRLTPYGWLWNVSGLDAVHLELTEDRGFRIGTDQPRELAGAIRAATGFEDG